MMVPLLLPLPGNEQLARALAKALGVGVGSLEVRRFPDRESYLRLHCDVAGRHVALVCTLSDPDSKLAQLLFAADLVRDLGGAGVGLIAPYLAYMRQDRRFEVGEALTSRSFAALISRAFDWLATVDPHLHRYSALNEIYDVPAGVAHAASLIGDWIKTHVDRPLIVGPDSESEQWVADVAGRADAPHITFSKRRLGDRDVSIVAPYLAGFHGRRPVLVDDIASSGRTLAEAARHLVEAGFPRPVCLVVHALFRDGAIEALLPVTSEIVSTDTIAHSTNKIGVAGQLANVVRQLTAQKPARGWGNVRGLRPADPA